MMDVRFSLASYLKDKAAFLAAFALFVFLLAALLLTAGLNAQAACLACALAFLFFAGSLAADFLRKRRFYKELRHAISHLGKTRYLPELLSEPTFLDGRLAYQSLEFVCRLSGEETTALQEDAKAYRDYIELWIHEVKTPLAAVKLMLARMRGPDAFALKQELERIEFQVESALYYARSTSLSYDYRITESPLLGIVQEACKKNASFLVSKGTQVDLSAVPEELAVLTDASWTSFVMGQVVTNAAKYGAENIRFKAFMQDAGTSRSSTVLEIQDDGQGVPLEDAPHVFERGFVGANGRAQGSATGMGLYLCSIMCQRMGLGISLTTDEGSGTTVSITFPHDRRRMAFLTES